jgi:hypothetical protein
MAPSRLRQRTLLRALEIVGDHYVLARRLRVPMDELRAWLAGADVPPTAVFLAAVDIVGSQIEPPQAPRLFERRRSQRDAATLVRPSA